MGVFTLALVPLLVGGVLAVLSRSATIVPDIGASLIGGAITGLVFAFVQYTMAQRNQAEDKDIDLRLLLTSSRDLPGIDLSYRVLRGVYLQGKTLESARFHGADLSAATLDAAVLNGAMLSSANLDKAMLRGVRARRAVFTKGTLVEADLTGADLTEAVMQAAVLDRADLSDARLSGADLTRASLAGAVLDRADLDDARLNHATGRAARLARTRLRRATLQFSDLAGAQLARADLTGAQLMGANLASAILIRANLSGVVATGCSLIRADLTGCQLKDSDLRWADLTGALLTGCDLRGADLTGALLDAVQGRDTVRSDARTRWPEAARSEAAKEAARRDPEPGTGVRQIIVVAAHRQALPYVRDIAAELAAQQVVFRSVQEGRMSLPLGVRPPRELRVRVARSMAQRLHRPSTAVVAVDITDSPGGREVTLTVTAKGKSSTLSPVPVDNRGPDPIDENTPDLVDGESYPPAVDELAAKILNLVDPRDGSSWLVRMYVMMAIKRWNAEGRPASGYCRRILLAAHLLDRRSPVVNYALGALAYNQYDAALTKESIEYFAVANASATRLCPDMEGLAGLCLTGLALSYCQLYHRFGEDSPDILAAGRSAAAMAVAETRRRLESRKLSATVRRNAMEGYALARYAEAFAQHVTEEDDDVKASIPVYEDAINTLRIVKAPVPAVLYNNLGYQHMTLAGLKERGSDTATYRAARRLFQKAVETSPGLHFGWANLGNVDRLLGNPADAEPSYRRALTIVAEDGGKYPPGWNELACVLLELGGRDNEAWEAHRQAVADASSAAVRARLRAEFAQSLVLVGHADKAASVAEQGLAEDPDNRFCRHALEEARSVS